MTIYAPSSGGLGAPDLASYRDRLGLIKVDNMRVEVKIRDARLRFGHLDLLVTPVAGEGERWVEQHRIALVDEAPAAPEEIPAFVGSIGTPEFDG